MHIYTGPDHGVVVWEAVSLGKVVRNTAPEVLDILIKSLAK